MNVMKEEIYTHTNPETGGPACHPGSSQEAEMGRGQGKARVLIAVWGKGRGRVSSGQEGLNSFQRALL